MNTKYMHGAIAIIVSCITKFFVKRFGFSKAVSLEEALMYCDIDVDGRLHDGLDDAANTAKLIKTLEMNKDFVLCHCDIDYKTDSEPLSFSMGNLFAGLKLSV
ncbi:MAG: hypothetical protein U0L05_05385 [Schaedlerella sp.]|nr:hypothetical protein [Schaedlerella sp.]